MKILFVIAALRNGGAERVLQVLANHFVHANDVTIAILENDEGRYKFSEKIKFLHLDVYKNGGRFDKYRILRECFKRERPSVIISFMDWTNVACVIASFGLGIPLIVTEHNAHDYLPSGLFSRVRDLCYKKADALTVLTRSDFEYYSRFVKNCFIVHNPFFGEICDTNGAKRNVILSVGRLEPVKGYEIYFDALNRIDKSLLAKWEILIAGDGSLRESLRELVARLGLEVRFLGHKQDVSELYKEAKIFVLSSLNEGLSNVLIESAFYGCARLSSDTAGAKELIKDGFSGILFKRGDANELASKLEILMSDKALRDALVQNANENLDEFSQERIIKLWQGLIDRFARK